MGIHTYSEVSLQRSLRDLERQQNARIADLRRSHDLVMRDLERLQQTEMPQLGQDYNPVTRSSVLGYSDYSSARRPEDENEFRSHANRMTMGKVIKYALIGAAYGAAAVFGATLGAPGAAALGIGAAVGAVAFPAVRAISKTLGRGIVIAPPVIAATAAAGVGNVLSWGLLGIGTIGAIATIHGLTNMRPTPISTLPSFSRYHY